MKFINLSNKKLISFLVFLTIFVVGIAIYKDYGVSIDDQIYLANGQYYYHYIKSLFTEVDQGFLESLNILNKQLGGEDIIIHPVVFEVTLVGLLNLFNIKETQQIFEFSHLLNFLIFFLSLYFFYRLILKRFNSYEYALVGLILLFLTPRILAESFYNSRDIFFLSLFIFNMYASFIFIDNPNYKNSFFFSLTSALLIDAKVVGLISPLLMFIFIFFKSLGNSNFLKKNIKYIIFTFLLIFIFIILFWPFLWTNPLKNLLFAFTDIIREQNSLVILQLYLGEYILSSDSPWHYRPMWFLVTTPLIVLLLFFTGLIFITLRFTNRLFRFDEKINNDLWKSNLEMFDLYCFLIILVSFIITILFNTSQYGGWRHLYYIYPSVIIVSVYGFYRLKIYITKINIKFLIIALIFLNSIYLIQWNIKFHPFQNVYFNLLSKKYAINNFDLDYWGLSHKFSLEHIIKTNTNFPIHVGTVSFTNLETSRLMLDKNDQKKIIIVHDLNNADFIITNYMKRIRKNFVMDENKFKKYHEIQINKKSINTVYKKDN